VIHTGDALAVLRTLPAESVHCCVTSPPYWGLRAYGTTPVEWPDGWVGEHGLEPTPELYVAHEVLIFREVRRVLRSDGTCWANLGDSYAANGKSGLGTTEGHGAFNGGAKNDNRIREKIVPAGLKPKDLCGIPWKVAFALQADGWYLRSDIIWCLSGGTYVYAWGQKGPQPMTVKDLARLDPQTVRLWNGERWTRLLGISRSPRAGTEIEIVLRSGERIACTPTHRFPTDCGLLAASEIRPGDVIRCTTLPEPVDPKDCALDEDAAWFAGLYIAEGSRAGDTIQIAGHARETARLERLRRVAAKYGGSLAVTVQGSGQAVRMYGKVLAAILSELVSGKTAHDKGFAPVVWRYSNRFLAAMVDGYLDGDGHYEPENDRWRLGFCRNYNLERDLRAACARLGYRLVLALASVAYHGRQVPTFRGELRKVPASGHWNEKPLGQVVEVRRARCRQVYDLGVEDEPHLFALASGVLTHNSKPNPMPESVTDRPTKAHEYIFLLSKGPRYFYDAEAVKEASSPNTNPHQKHWNPPGENTHGEQNRKRGDRNDSQRKYFDGVSRNRRTVWTISYEYDKITPWIGKIGLCPRCGGLRVVGNGLGPMTFRDMGDSPAPTEHTRENCEPIASHTNCSSAQSLPDSQLTMFAETEAASIQRTSKPSPCEKMSCEEIQLPQKTLKKLTVRLDTNTLSQTLISAVTVNGNAVHVCGCGEENNSRGSVWSVATQPFSDCHFATFPPKLIEPCILAGCPAQACPECGAPWVRVVERDGTGPKFKPLAITESGGLPLDGVGTHRNLGGRYQKWLDEHPAQTKGFRPTCACGRPDSVPGVVLDPFGGAGTTALVAVRLARRYVLIELNPEYVDMARRRLRQEAPLFEEVTS
jgi:hypothetical protein